MRASLFADALAIPCFAALFAYFYQKRAQQQLTDEERLLMAFAATGFICDTLFVTGLVR